MDGFKCDGIRFDSRTFALTAHLDQLGKDSRGYHTATAHTVENTSPPLLCLLLALAVRARRVRLVRPGEPPLDVLDDAALQLLLALDAGRVLLAGDDVCPVAGAAAAAVALVGAGDAGADGRLCAVGGLLLGAGVGEGGRVDKVAGAAAAGARVLVLGGRCA